MPRMPHFLGGPQLKVEIWQTSNRRAPNSASVGHKTTGAPIHVPSIICMKSLSFAWEHILTSDDAFYLKSAFLKHIDWKYPPIRRWNCIVWFSLKSRKVDAPPLLRWKHIFPAWQFPRFHFIASYLLLMVGIYYPLLELSPLFFLEIPSNFDLISIVVFVFFFNH